MSTAISDLLNGIDIKGLDAAGIEQYDALKAMLSDLDTLMVWQQKQRRHPLPQAQAIPTPWQAGYVPDGPLTQTYNPLAHEGKGVSEVTLDRPKLTIRDFLLPGPGQRMQQFESSLAVSNRTADHQHRHRT